MEARKLDDNDLAAWDAYFSWFHDSNVWKSMHYHGIRTLKLPSDMWNYQEIIFDNKIDFVIETGTRHGGSALFFADTLSARNAGGFVVSVDVDAGSNQVVDPRIRFLIGDSGSEQMAGQMFAMLPQTRGRLFMILDSDHRADHVFRELSVLVPYLRSGDYLVVEDGCVNGHPVRRDFGPGPWEAVHQFIAANPGLLVHDVDRERKFGCTAAPCGYYVAT